MEHGRAPRPWARRLRHLPPPLRGWRGEVWDPDQQAWVRPPDGPCWPVEKNAAAMDWLEACEVAHESVSR